MKSKLHLFCAVLIVQLLSVRGSDDIYPAKVITAAGHPIILSIVVFNPPITVVKGVITNAHARPLDEKELVWLNTWKNTNDYQLDLPLAEYKTYFEPDYFSGQDLTEASYQAAIAYKRNPDNSPVYANDTLYYQFIVTKENSSVCVVGHIFGKEPAFAPTKAVIPYVYRLDPNTHKWLSADLLNKKWLIQMHPTYLHDLLDMYQRGIMKP